MRRIPNLKLRYIVALGLIATLSLLAYWNLSALIEKHSKYAHWINVSGKQRMLSQQIALFANTAKYEAMERAIEQMERAHRYLLSLSDLPEQVRSLVLREGVDEKVIGYLQLAKAFLQRHDPALLDRINAHSGDVLELLDRMVLAFQHASEDQTKMIVTRERFILLFTFAILILEALFIFHPAVVRIEEFLRQLLQEKRFEEEIVNSSPVAIIAVDDQQRVKVFSKRAEEIFGFAKDEFTSLHQIIPPELRERHEAGFRRFLREKRIRFTEPTELTAMRKDGSRFPIRITFGLVNFAHESIVIANIEDITKEKEQDRIIAQQSRHAAMGEMIANIAHQWRQPLNAIKIVASGLKLRSKMGKVDGEQIKGEAEKIVRYTDYLSQTIDDFRNFFKPQRQKECFDLRTALQKSLDLTQAALRNNDIEVEVLDRCSHCKVEGYPNELVQVLINIINNAKDVFKERKIERPKLTIELADGPIFRICDNGGGIDEQYLLKIFDPYFTTKHQSQGTGIGLYMSKTIVEKHFGGKIYAQNSDAGACFVIDLSKAACAVAQTT